MQKSPAAASSRGARRAPAALVRAPSALRSGTTAQEENLVVIDSIKMGEIKTKSFKSFLKAVNADCKALVVTAENDELVVKSAANIPGVMVTFANLINVYDILNAKKLVVDQAALAKIEEVFA